MSSSSPSLEGLASIHTYPLLTPKAKEKSSKTDWEWISTIVVAVIGALIAALSVICIMGIFPPELLGGLPWASVTFFIGAAIAAPAGLILFDKWQNPPKKGS